MAEYTDDERIAASQIAYSDEINYGYQVLHAEYPERDSFTVEECLAGFERLRQEYPVSEK